MNSFQIYTFQNRPVRVAGSPENPLFCAADVYETLGFSSPRQTIANLPEDEKGVEIINTLGGKQNMTFLTEAGLYRLIFRSSKPDAESFRRWVMHDVLPSVRKTGAYPVEVLDEICGEEIAKGGAQ